MFEVAAQVNFNIAGTVDIVPNEQRNLVQLVVVEITDEQTEWATKTIVVKRMSGVLRMCIELQSLNKAII